VDADGQVLPPIAWDEEERRARLAALDALFFYLYGLDANDAAYILDTFPIVREQDIKAFGSYRTKDDVLNHLKVVPPEAAGSGLHGPLAVKKPSATENVLQIGHIPASEGHGLL
jgi:hypothetical protein